MRRISGTSERVNVFATARQTITPPLYLLRDPASDDLTAFPAAAVDHQNAWRAANTNNSTVTAMHSKVAMIAPRAFRT